MNWYKRAESVQKEMSDLSLVNLDLIAGHVADVKGWVEQGKKLKPWMIDKIATARNDLNDVNMCLSK